MKYPCNKPVWKPTGYGTPYFFYYLHTLGPLTQDWDNEYYRYKIRILAGESVYSKASISTTQILLENSSLTSSPSLFTDTSFITVST
jgi:hypothetical protein